MEANLDLSVRDALQTTSAALVGTWVGTARSPGWYPDSWELILTFQADGTYDARAYSEIPQARAFHWGTDLPCAFKRWQLDHVGAEGVGGELEIVISDGFEDPCQPPSWQAQLENIALDPEGDRLRFLVYSYRGHGPIRYELLRVCE